MCRLTIILNFEVQKESNFIINLKSVYEGLFEKFTEPFKKSLEHLVQEDRKDSIDSIFCYKNHIKNLLKYSHH
jgi:hypothetical protein